MKKILLTTSALVALTGTASAEIALSGWAEIGISGGNQGFETQFHNDWQVNFDFTGTTEGGVEFGGLVQIEEQEDPSSINGGVKIDEEAFWVSGSFGTVTLGETDGAYDWALSGAYSGTAIYSGTSIADDHSTHLGAYWFTGLDGTYGDQILRYDYAFGDFAVAASAEIDDTGVGDPVLAVGGNWHGTVSGVELGVGVGYQENDTNEIYGLGASAAFTNGLYVALGYADLDDTQFHTSNGFTTTPFLDSWWGVGVAYTTGALTVGANYGSFDSDVGDLTGWGVVANYDLGGGAYAMAGYGSSDDPSGQGAGSWNGKGDETWSIGLGLAF